MLRADVANLLSGLGPRGGQMTERMISGDLIGV